MRTHARRISTAVMARRHEPADSLDYFPTPPWATRAFCEYVMPVLCDTCARSGIALDPACGEGHMALALAEYFDKVLAADIHDYGFGVVQDFLADNQPQHLREADWIITNPPFNLATEFVLTALQRAKWGVAVLVRSQFVEGKDRYRRLFADFPPHLIAQYAERVPMHRNRWVINGTTATSYQWLCWLTRSPSWTHSPRAGTRLIWIPPCRTHLTKSPADWLAFGGCMDIPKTHKAIKLMERQEEAA